MCNFPNKFIHLILIFIRIIPRTCAVLYVSVYCDVIIDRKSDHKHFQIQLFGLSSQGFSCTTVLQWSSLKRLYLSHSSSSSFCHISPSLCPVSRPFFYFFRLSSSRVVLSGPVLPETPRTSPFSVFSFSFQTSLVLSLTLNTLPLSTYFFLFLSLSPSHPPPKDKKRSPLKSSGLFFFSPLQKYLNLNPFFNSRTWFIEKIHLPSCVWDWKEMICIISKL